MFILPILLFQQRSYCLILNKGLFLSFSKIYIFNFKNLVFWVTGLLSFIFHIRPVPTILSPTKTWVSYFWPDFNRTFFDVLPDSLCYQPTVWYYNCNTWWPLCISRNKKMPKILIPKNKCILLWNKHQNCRSSPVFKIKFLVNWSLRSAIIVLKVVSVTNCQF